MVLTLFDYFEKNKKNKDNAKNERQENNVGDVEDRFKCEGAVSEIYSPEKPFCLNEESTSVIDKRSDKVSGKTQFIFDLIKKEYYPPRSWGALVNKAFLPSTKTAAGKNDEKRKNQLIFNRRRTYEENDWSGSLRLLQRTISITELEKAEGFTPRFKNIISGDDWTRPPGTGTFAIDSARSESWARNFSHISVGQKNMSYILSCVKDINYTKYEDQPSNSDENHCIDPGEEVRTDTPTRTKLEYKLEPGSFEERIVAACWHSKTKWFPFNKLMSSWFRNHDASELMLMNAIDTLKEQDIIMDVRDLLAGPSDENIMVSTVCLISNFLNKGELLNILKHLQSVAKRKRKAQAYANFSKIEIIACFFPYLKLTPQSTRNSVDMFGYLMRCLLEKLGSTCICLTDRMREHLLRSYRYFFLGLGVSAAESSIMLRKDLSNIKFVKATHRIQGTETCLVSNIHIPFSAQFRNVEKFLNMYDKLHLYTLCGDEASAYKILHEASSECLSLPLERDLENEEFEEFDNVWVDIQARILFKVMMHGCHLLERDKMYESAEHYLGIIVAKYDIDRYRCLYARAVIRLATDLEHMKHRASAISLLETALKKRSRILCPLTNTNILGSFGASMIRMLHRMSTPPHRWSVGINGLEQLLEASKVTIYKDEESHIHKDMAGKRKRGQSVEDIALDHYSRKEKWKGLHAENGIVLTIFVILLWDAIFFCSSFPALLPIQDLPLSLLNGSLMMSSNKGESQRREMILKRIKELRDGKGPDILEKMWTNHYGTYARGVNWSRNSMSELKHIVGTLGPNILANIISLFAQSYMGWSGGFPDLFLWNQEKIKFVEVKGPGDTLSDRQRAWIDQLIRSGADVEVCHVRMNLK